METNLNPNSRSKLSLGDKIADKVARTVGSWKFILIQSLIILIWIGLNVIIFKDWWDPYPFILLNLLLSFQAAYTAPMIMMSQNRREEKDRRRSQIDLQTDKKAEREIEEIQDQLNRLEEKIDEILRIKN